MNDELAKMIKEIREKDLILNTILEYTLAGYWDWDIPKRYKYYSHTFKQMFGYEGNEIANEPEAWKKVIDKDYIKLLDDSWLKHVESKGAKPYSHQIKCYHKSGAVVWVLVQGRVVEWSEDNQPLRAIGVQMDITPMVEKHRSVTLQKLSSSIKYKNALLDIIPDTILVVNKDLEVIEYNAYEKLHKYFGISDLKQKRLEHLLNPTLYKQAYMAIDELELGYKDIVYHNFNVEIDGVQKYFEARVKPFTDDNYIIILRDFTYSKVQEESLLAAKVQAEESSKLKSAFLANVSHEIRTPMNAIIGFSNILDETATESQKEYTDIIVSSGKHLLNLIDDIIEISKYEAKNLVVKYEDFSLNQLIESIFQSFESKGLPEIDIIIEKGFADGRDNIRTDITKLRQILTNLISNAIKFTEEGYIKLAYTLEDDMLSFIVEDTGVGIAEKDMENLFERFARSSDSNKNIQHTGTGLGLAITKSSIELLNGKIYVESEIDKGSKFKFVIPYIIDNMVKRKSLHIREKNINLPKVDIIVAEDDFYSYELIRMSLRQFDINITHVSDGKQLVEAVKEKKFDIALVDIKMPVMDGLEAVKEIRKFNKDLILIAQTANAFDEDKKIAKEIGCNDFIVKPIHANSLIEIINKYI